MNDLFLFAAHNTVVALVFALFVSGLTRVWRNPPVAHVLWLLVLLKLVAPPVLRIDRTGAAGLLPDSTPADGHSSAFADGSRVEGREELETHPRFVDRPTGRTPVPVASVTSVKPAYDYSAGIRMHLWNRGRPVLFWLWLAGAAMCALVAATRIVRFERLLRDTLPASERLQRLATETAGKLGVRRVPDVRYVECVGVPFLWCAGGRPTIVLPMRMLSQLDEQSSVLILAHELAHLRRRDHWVRVVELIVSTVYWWNPLAWVIRRQIHEFEDLCCDAWVRWAFPDCTKRYAEVVLKAAESLNASQVGARLLPASPFLHSLSLKARIEMILEGRFAPRLSSEINVRRLGLVAMLVLPSFVPTARTQSLGEVRNERRTGDAGPEVRDSHDFRISIRGPIRAGRDPLLERRHDHHPRSPRHRRHVHAGPSLLDQGSLFAGLARPGQVGCLHHRDGYEYECDHGHARPGRADHAFPGRKIRVAPGQRQRHLASKSRRPSSIRATVRSRSSCRCHPGVGRTSAFTRPTAVAVSAATILERAILS